MANGRTKRVITRAGRAVFSNGELVGEFDNPQIAEQEAQKFAAGPGNVRGSTSGETFRREVFNRSETNPAMSPQDKIRTAQQNEEGASAAGERRLRRQGLETPRETMARLKGTNFATDQARQDTLAGSLGESSLPPGTDVPSTLEENPDTRALVEEAIRIQTGQQPPQTGTPDVPETQTGVSTSQPAEQDMQDMQDQITQAEQENIEEQRSILAGIAGGDATTGGGQSGASMGTGGGTGDLQTAGVDFEMPDGSNAQDLIAEQRSQIQSNLDAELQAIKERYRSERISQQRQNEARTGATRGLVARAGAGTFQSGRSAIQEEIQRGEEAMTELARIESQSLRAAREAAMGNDIELLEKSIKRAREARQERNDIRQQQFDNFVARRQEDRSQQEFDFSRAQQQFEVTQETLSQMSPEEIQNIPDEQFDTIGNNLGLSGSAIKQNVLATAQQNQRTQATEQFNTIAEMGGISALGPEELSNFAQQLDVPESVLQNAAAQAAAGDSRVENVGGDLVQIRENPDGTFEVDALWTDADRQTTTGDGPSGPGPGPGPSSDASPTVRAGLQRALANVGIMDMSNEDLANIDPESLALQADTRSIALELTEGAGLQEDRESIDKLATQIETNLISQLETAKEDAALNVGDDTGEGDTADEEPRDTSPETVGDVVKGQAWEAAQAAFFSNPLRVAQELGVSTFNGLRELMKQQPRVVEQAIKNINEE